MIPRLSAAALKKLAADYVDGKIFTSASVPGSELVHLVFLPLMFYGQYVPSTRSDEFKAGVETAIRKAEAQEQRAAMSDIGLVYEYLDAAGPTRLNGYPIFHSCRLVHKDDLKLLQAEVDKYKEVLTDE